MIMIIISYWVKVMELSISLTKQIMAMFIMILVGFILIKKKICRIDDSKMLSAIVLYVAAPCAIINSFLIKCTPEKMKGFILAIIAAIIVHIIYIMLTYILGKFFHFNTIEKASIIYSNCGNLILPLVQIVLGQEMVFYASGYMIVQTILLWTHCKFMMSEDKSFDLKKILFNINILSILIGIILFFIQVSLPVPVTSAMNSMSNLMGPLSMFVIGMLLAKMNLKAVFRKKRVYFICFFRLIVLPLVILLIFVYSGIDHIAPNGTSILLISLLAASAPSASTVTQFAQIYDNNPGGASVINAMSVILCVVTMPLMIMIYNMLI